MLVAVVGDIHGRFFRVEEWLRGIEDARKQPVELVIAVGDVETFATADDHRRKATKRTMPAEFAAYSQHERTMERPFWFVGGNNEAFEDLEKMPDGGELTTNVRYLGHAGLKTLHGLRVAYLSGIFAPTRYDRPRLAATTRETIKQAGYFRDTEVAALRGLTGVDVLLLHEWPRGVAGRESAVARAESRGIRQGYWPLVGNPHASELMMSLRPAWVLCGHLHVPHATTVTWTNARPTRVVCLDQAARAESGFLWMEWQNGQAVEVGWGTDSTPTWTEGQAWDERQTAGRIHRGE